MFAAKNSLLTPSKKLVKYGATGGNQSGYVGTYSWTHNPAATDNMIVMGFLCNTYGTMSTPTCGGTAMNVGNYTASGGFSIGCYYLAITPGSGSKVITGTVSGNGYFAGSSTSYSGVARVGTGVYASASGLAVSTSYSAYLGSLIFGVGGTTAGTTVYSTTGNLRWYKDFASSVNYPTVIWDQPGWNYNSNVATANFSSSGTAASIILPLYPN